MRIRKNVPLIAGVFLLALLGLRLLPTAKKIPEPKVCWGAESHVVQRSEDYVREHVRKLAEEAREVDSGIQPLDVVFYGDSIAETWRGTDMGRECGRCQGGQEIFHKYFGSRYSAKIFAVGGDQSAHLQWRLLHGELLVQNPPRVAVLMIGTNDLGAAAECFGYNATLIASAVKKTFERIEAIIDFLRIHTPSTKVVVLGLTPRGVWSPESRKFEWPSVYTMPIDTLNHILHRLAAGQDTVHYVDCGDKLLANSEIDERMQGDGLHPTPEGLSILAACILSAVESIIGPGQRPDNLNQHPLPLKLWMNDQMSGGGFWKV